MKKLWLAVCGMALVTLLGAGFSAAADITYTGEIMDSACAKAGTHEGMMKKAGITSEKDCTLGCVKHGSKFVLYNADKKATYQLDDQTKPTDFAGQKVRVTGTLDKATGTIHVTDIKPGS